MPTPLIELSSQPMYQSANINGSPDSSRIGAIPALSTRLSSQTNPRWSPWMTSHCRSAHPLWQMGIAPFMIAGFQYRSSSTFSQTSQRSSSSPGGVPGGGYGSSSQNDSGRFQADMCGNGFEGSPTRPPPSQSPTSSLPKGRTP